MDFFMCTIASGSSGNCTYVQAGNVKILIDAGISGKKIVQGLEKIEVNPDSIDAILVTHEHSDHIKGVGIFSRKYNTNIYATKKTWEKIDEGNMIGKVAQENKIVFEKEETFYLEELRVFPYSIYHDAIDPVGYLFEYGNKKIAMATDLGMVDDRILGYLKASDGILLEFNHDVNMLQAGSYPYYLKKRVLSDYGHMNNEDAAKVLTDIYHSKLKWILLGHLSNENNLPDLAYLTAKMALEQNDIKVGEDVELEVASRHENSTIFYV